MNARPLHKYSISNGYFRVPDFIFDEYHQLSIIAKIIFCYLCRRVNRSGSCFPSQERIGMDCGIKSPKTVRKGLSELEDAGLIYIKSGKEGSRCDSYQLTEKVMKFMANKTLNTRDTNEQNLPIRDVKNTYVSRQNLPTKEYTKKENKYKERANISTQIRTEETESSLDIEYLQTNTNDSNEPPKELRGNSIPHQKYSKSLEDLIDRKDDVSHETLVREFDKVRLGHKQNCSKSH